MSDQEIEDEYLDSFGQYSSLGSSPCIKQFLLSASPVSPTREYSHCSFIDALGLAQRLNVKLIPMMWHARLGLVGRGGQAKVNRARVNQLISFAFKRFSRRHGVTDSFQEIVREMSLLAHPAVRRHKHIVKLEGICCEVMHEREVWPVLMFQNSECGDLDDFIRSERGSAISLEERLDLCGGVAIAIRDMHMNNIIHGDIKPGNILVFEDGSELYLTAKVADFGFSTKFRSHDSLISMPVSAPWTGPEHKGQKFNTLEAKRMDVYSFSMVCLSLIFSMKDDSLAVMLGLTAATAIDVDHRRMEWIKEQVARDGCIEARRKGDLIEFFTKSLCVEPRARTTDWAHLLKLLVPERDIPDTQVLDEDTLTMKGDFQIAPWIWSFYSMDFRIRSFVAEQLKAIVSSGPKEIFENVSVANATEQLALCYKLGFGSLKDAEAERGISVSVSQRSAIEDQLRLIREDMEDDQVFAADEGVMDELVDMGFRPSIQLEKYYAASGMLSEAITTCQREMQGVSEVLGAEHSIYLTLQEHLARMLQEDGRLEEAEEVQLQVISDEAGPPEDETAATLTNVLRLGSLYRLQGRLDEAEILCRDLKRQAEHLDLQPAFVLTIRAELGRIYALQHQWKKVEKACVWGELANGDRNVLGPENEAIFSAMTNLALSYHHQQRLEEAEELGIRTLKIKARVLGYGDPSTLDSLCNLALTLRSRGRSDEAFPLMSMCSQMREQVLGSEHANTQDAFKALSEWQRGALEGEHPEASAVLAQILSTGDSDQGAADDEESSDEADQMIEGVRSDDEEDEDAEWIDGEQCSTVRTKKGSRLKVDLLHVDGEAYPVLPYDYVLNHIEREP